MAGLRGSPCFFERAQSGHAEDRDGPPGLARTALSWVTGIGAVVFLKLNGSPIVENFNGATVLAALLIPFVGALIVGRRPWNPIGWFYVFAGVTQSIGIFSGEWARYTFFTSPG
jgi:hypothetical protein